MTMHVVLLRFRANWDASEPDLTSNHTGVVYEFCDGNTLRSEVDSNQVATVAVCVSSGNNILL